MTMVWVANCLLQGSTSIEEELMGRSEIDAHAGSICKQLQTVAQCEVARNAIIRLPSSR